MFFRNYGNGEGGGGKYNKLMSLWHVSHRRGTKAQNSLHFRPVPPEHSLLAHIMVDIVEDTGYSESYLSAHTFGLITKKHTLVPLTLFIQDTLENSEDPDEIPH